MCSEKVFPPRFSENTLPNVFLVNEILGDHNVDKQMTDSRDDVGAIESRQHDSHTDYVLGRLPNG